MIVYGVTASVAIDKLFLGGFIPGFLLAGALCVMVAWYSKKRGYPKLGSFSVKRVLDSFRDTLWALFTPVIIIVGILAGVFTATEAGAVAAIYALVIALFIYREIRLRDIPTIFYEAIFTTATILFIVSTASIFGWVLSFNQIPKLAAQFLVGLTENRYILLILFSVMYIILGALMEATAIVVMTVPVVVPIFSALGIDLVHFGVVLALLMSMGTITPPVGTVMFVLCKTTNQPVDAFARFIMPWVGCIFIVILILIFMPQLVLFVPNFFS